MKKTIYSFYEKQAQAKGEVAIGLDEVGRGCLAGPIVTAAVALTSFKKNALIKDSKLLNEMQLEKAYQWIVKNCQFAIGITHHRTIDRINIHQANIWTLRRAAIQLSAMLHKKPDIILVDALPITLPFGVTIAMTQGESKSISIAAASIIAKVTRDRIMKRMHIDFPNYGLAAHKGYATALHQTSIKKNGISIVHRLSFLHKLQKTIADSKQQTIFDTSEVTP
jgi:Ribonuclease HII